MTKTTVYIAVLIATLVLALIDGVGFILLAPYAAYRLTRYLLIRYLRYRRDRIPIGSKEDLERIRDYNKKLDKIYGYE